VENVLSTAYEPDNLKLILGIHARIRPGRFSDDFAIVLNRNPRWVDFQKLEQGFNEQAFRNAARFPVHRNLNGGI